MKNAVTLVVIIAALSLAMRWLDQGLSSKPGSKNSTGSLQGLPSGFLSNYETALNRAKTENKPIVLIFSASWCPPCQQMKKNVYPSTEVAAYKDRFIWAYLDVDDPANQAIGAKYGVQGIPHIQFVKPNGSPITRQVGGSSARDFAQQLATILRSQ